MFKFKKGEWYQIKDIGDCCLFLGVNQTICLSPVPRGYPPNCTYCTDDCPVYRRCNHSLPIRDGNMAVYSIVSGKFSQFYNGFHKLNPPWLTLNSYYNNILFFFFSKNDTNDCLKWQKHSGVSIETNQRSEIKIIMIMT